MPLPSEPVSFLSAGPELLLVAETHNTTSDEARFVARLRSGDEASYEQLVRAYGGRLLAVANRLLRSEHDARDCLQDAFLLAFRHIDRFQQNSSLETWLHRIVVNAALMKLRTRSRRNHREVPLESLGPEFDTDGMRTEPAPLHLASAEALLERVETRALVRQAIDQLPESYRTVLILRDIEGYDTGETAQLLEVTAGAVKTRLHRARCELRRLLEPLMRSQEL